jgi:hypothetical protein
MLFNIVDDMFSILHAMVDGLIERAIPHLVDGGISILQYTDNTILFMEHDLEKKRNLKLIILAFEQLLGLNFHKSELFYLGEAQEEVNAYADLFGYGYLGIQIHYQRLIIAKWKLTEERLQN